MPSGTDKLEILLEEMRSNFKALGEGHDSVRQKVDVIASDVGALKTDVRTIKDYLGLNGAARPTRSPKRPRSRKK